MNKLYLSFFVLFTGASALAQDTTATPVLNKSNRIILHFSDTTGKFMQLAHIFIDRGYDIDMKDPELGILRTKPGALRGADSFLDEVEIKAIFRDRTITFSGVTHGISTGPGLTRYQIKYEVHYSKKWDRNIELSWEEMEKIAELLQPTFITYSTVGVTAKPPRVGSWYKRMN